MPFVNQAQQAAMHAKANRGEISQATIKEFDAATDFKHLPKDPKPASTNEGHEMPVPTVQPHQTEPHKKALERVEEHRRPSEHRTAAHDEAFRKGPDGRDHDCCGRC